LTIHNSQLTIHHSPLTIHHFIQQLKDHHAPINGRYLAAVSGGIDSVALCELCREAGLHFAIAHCNFQLRGEESRRDEDFVRSLAERYGVEVFVKKFDTGTLAEESRSSIQETARRLRYEWFEELREEKGYDWILMAHHAGDNIETLLMNFFRGTGLDGLTGIPSIAAQARCLRPMLPFTRSEIEQYAGEKGLQWVEDSSNASDRYTRNYFRNQLIPQLQKVFPKVEENLLGNIGRLGGTQKLYRQMLEQLKSKLLRSEGSDLKVPVLELMKYKHTSLPYEIIREYGFNEKQVDELIRLAQSDSGKFIESASHQVIRHRHWFIIARKREASSAIGIASASEPVTFPGGTLHFGHHPAEGIVLEKTSPNIAFLDASKIAFPLILRKWKQGDYFYPLGMNKKKKKLKKFFIDLKLPKNKKADVWVLESDKKIVWVIGLRIDDRFKITDKTRHVMEISLQNEHPVSRKDAKS
jgi:tRNA(Ile)-lysidine synthase